MSATRTSPRVPFPATSCVLDKLRDSQRPMTTERLFIALTLPEAVRAVLARTAEPIPGVSWTRPEQLHMTLRFLGDVPETQHDGIVARLASVRVQPFILPVEGVGTFPANRPPRVIWVGAGTGHPRLFQLRQRLDDALIAAGLQLDVRAFHPHVTLGRATEDAARAVAHWMQVHREFSAPPFQVEGFDLYSSDLQQAGAIHTLKRSFPFAAS